MIQLTNADIQRFYQKCEIQSNGCILWKDKESKGYGRFCVNGENKLAHHISWVMKHQRPPANYIKHTCGNTLCVNADHLVDCGNEGRKPEISFVDILAKKKSGLSTTQIADELGCDPTTVRRRLRKGH